MATGLHRVRYLLLVTALVGCSKRAPVRPVLAASVSVAPVASGAASEDLLSAEELKSLLRQVRFDGAGQPAPVRLADLEAAARRSGPAERALIVRMIRLVRAFDPSRGTPTPEELLDFLTEYAGILRGVGELYPNDLSTQLMVAATLGTLPAMMDSFDLEDRTAATAFRAQAAQRAELLLQRFPNVADVHALRASLCDHANEEPLSCLRQWARCAELDPKNRCAEEYSARARDYTAPFCSGANIRAQLGFRAVHGTAVDPAPSFSGADLESIGTTPATEQQEVRIRLKPERTAAFEAWTGSLVADRSAMVLLRGTKLVSRATVRTALSSSFLVNVELGELCAKTEQKALPRELPAPP